MLTGLMRRLRRAQHADRPHVTALVCIYGLTTTVGAMTMPTEDETHAAAEAASSDILQTAMRNAEQPPERPQVPTQAEQYAAIAIKAENVRLGGRAAILNALMHHIRMARGDVFIFDVEDIRAFEQMEVWAARAIE